jgi:hypothetical protein
VRRRKRKRRDRRGSSRNIQVDARSPKYKEEKRRYLEVRPHKMEENKARGGEIQTGRRTDRETDPVFAPAQ